MTPAMVLSDRTIRRLVGEGHIGIDPFDETLVQPSSVDVRVDRYFRVFHNSRHPFIDVKEPMDDLTELVEVNSRPFILHPGEFVLGSTLERITLPTISSRGWRARARSGASACSSIPPPASSTRAGTDTSLSSFRTSPTFRSRSTSA